MTPDKGPSFPNSTCSELRACGLHRVLRAQPRVPEDQGVSAYPSSRLYVTGGHAATLYVVPWHCHPGPSWGFALDGEEGGCLQDLGPSAGLRAHRKHRPSSEVLGDSALKQCQRFSSRVPSAEQFYTMKPGCPAGCRRNKEV